jgi:hypothetical protein
MKMRQFVSNRHTSAPPKGIFVALLMSVLLGVVPQNAPAGDRLDSRNVSQDAEKEELLALLEVGLKPASPREFAFLVKVVQMVAERRLSREMVEGTFVWARRQSGWSFPYFEQALRMRARRAGIKI